MSSWTSRFVGSLCESKRDGLPFDAAFALAKHRHPPRLHELGVSRVGSDKLFDLDPLELSPAQAMEWWREVCEAAYHDAPAPDGTPSRMRGLRAALEDGFTFQDVPRVRLGGVGATAA